MSVPSQDVGIQALSPLIGGVDTHRHLGWLDARERQVAFWLIDLALVWGALVAVARTTSWPSIAAAIWVVALVLVGFYQPGRRWSPWHVAYEATKALVVGAGLLLAWNTLAAPTLGWPETAVGLGMGWVMAVSWRLAAWPAFAAVPARWVVVVGADEAGQAMAAEIRHRPEAGYQVIGFVDDDPRRQNRLVDGLPVLGPRTRLPMLTEALELDAVVVRDVPLDSRPTLVDCIERGANVLTMAALYEQLSARIPVPLIDIGWFIHEGQGGQRRLYATTRRALDVAVALAGLALTVLMLPAIALALKLGGGPGPLIYSQRRVGLRGREFTIYKFRTMRADAERQGAAWAAQNDARVTPVGRLLRRTRLDELPQFWNVLKGEMSVVGPRPERPEFTRVLAQEIPFYDRRHMVPPGLTGWAQVMFPYGASVEDAFEKLQFDLFYIKNRSFYLDLKIMLKTVGVMVRKIGAR